jgi:hypothetical protein
MSRYVRMVLLVLAGVFFMIPMLGRPAAAKPMPRLHGHAVNPLHHTAQQPDQLGDDSAAAPCEGQ